MTPRGDKINVCRRDTAMNAALLRRHRLAGWPPQRLFLDREQREERDPKEDSGDDEHEAERRRERARAGGAREPVEGEPLVTAEHYCGEYCHDDGAAELPEEAQGAGRDAELMQRHRVLDDHGRGWPHRA